MIWVLVVIVAVAGLVAAVVMFRRSRPVDGVAVFQRQIDALSPEARRPVVEKVSQLDDEAAADPPGIAPDSAADPSPSAEPDSPQPAGPPDDQSPEDPPRGS